jgi:hypothetical protein
MKQPESVLVLSLRLGLEEVLSIKKKNLSFEKVYHWLQFKKVKLEEVAFVGSESFPFLFCFQNKITKLRIKSFSLFPTYINTSDFCFLDWAEDEDVVSAFLSLGKLLLGDLCLN